MSIYTPLFCWLTFIHTENGVKKEAFFNYCFSAFCTFCEESKRGIENGNSILFSILWVQQTRDMVLFPFLTFPFHPTKHPIVVYTTKEHDNSSTYVEYKFEIGLSKTRPTPENCPDPDIPNRPESRTDHNRVGTRFGFFSLSGFGSGVETKSGLLRKTIQIGFVSGLGTIRARLGSGFG